MTTPEPIFVREVSRINDPKPVRGYVAAHLARRLIDGQEPAFTDPFLVMAEDWMPRGAFPLHPHRGIETVTFVIEGSVEHFDSAGNGGVIHAGDAQWMTAGRGVQHEENAPIGMIAHTLQLWVNLPAASKRTEPRYQDLVGSSMPVRREPGVEVRVFSGESGTVTSPTLNHVPITMLDARIEPDAAFHQRLPAGDNVFVYILEGEARIGGACESVRVNQLAWLSRSDEPGTSDLRLAAQHTKVRLLMFSGRPLREPIAFGGPFVMNTQAEIRQAFADFRAGRF
jgi:redox-sensitive bicupin YhaK (pirin superfamily)